MLNCNRRFFKQHQVEIVKRVHMQKLSSILRLNFGLEEDKMCRKKNNCDRFKGIICNKNENNNKKQIM